MAISMLKIRRSLGRLIFNMWIAIPGKTVFLIETPPWCGLIDSSLMRKISKTRLMGRWHLQMLVWSADISISDVTKWLGLGTQYTNGLSTYNWNSSETLFVLICSQMRQWNCHNVSQFDLSRRSNTFFHEWFVLWALSVTGVQRNR